MTTSLARTLTVSRNCLKDLEATQTATQCPWCGSWNLPEDQKRTGYGVWRGYICSRCDLDRRPIQ